MKILKGCCSVFLLLLFVLVLFLSLTVNSISSVVLSPKIILNFVDDLDFKETALKISEGVNKNIEKSEDGEPTDQNTEDNEESLSPEELDQVALDIVDSMSDEEKVLVKDTVKDFISEGFDFLKDSNKHEIRVDVSKAKSLIFKLILRTPDFKDHLGLPLPICETGQTEDCLSEDGVANIMEKSLTGELTEEDITSVIPVCTTSMMISQENCIPQDMISDLLASNIDQNTNEEDENALGNVLKGDEIVITEEDAGSDFVTVKDYISRIDLAVLIGLIITALVGVIIFLLQRVRGLWYVGSGLIITSILLFVPALIIKLQYEFLVGKLDDVGEITDNPFYNDILELFRQYSNAFAGGFLIRGGICLLLGVVILGAAYFLSRKKKLV